VAGRVNDAFLHGRDRFAAGLGARVAGTPPGMNDPTNDDLFLDAVDAIVLDALARIGADPRARFAFFKRLLAVAQEVAEGSAKRDGTSPDPSLLM